MPGTVEVRLPAQSEWGLVARNVVLSFATACGVEALHLDELGMVCGQIWEEVAYSPGVAEMLVKTDWNDGLIHLVVEGRPQEQALPDQGNSWSSGLTRVVVGQLTRTVTLHRSTDTIRIEANFPAATTGPSSF